MTIGFEIVLKKTETISFVNCVIYIIYIFIITEKLNVFLKKILYHQVNKMK